MADDRGVKTESAVFAKTKESVKLVRDSVDGSPVIKSDDNKYIYLPHPCPQDKHTPEGREQYKRYLSKAEYDNVPQFTLDALVGAMFRSDPEIKLPSNLEFLLDDMDGDGTSMNESMNVAASECLQMFYCGFLAEFSRIDGVSPEELTASEAQELNMRPSIKQYPRESIINQGFRTINGKKVLSLVVLKQHDMKRKPGRYDQEEVTSYLVLALDDDGDYFQEEYTETKDGDGEWSDPIYPKANGETLKYIPFEFIMSTKMQAGEIPSKLGYIHPVSEKAISRYQVSADMKESMWFSSAPIFTSDGWTEQAAALHEKMTGRKEIRVGPGSHIPIAEGGTFNIHSWDMANSSFISYMDKNAAEIRALGGVFDTTGTIDEQTATAAAIKAAEKTGTLSGIAGNIEKSFRKLIGYCGEFLGKPFDETVGGTEISIDRAFTVTKITAQEIQAITAAWMQGLMTTTDAQKNLRMGGLEIEEVNQLLDDQTGNNQPPVGEDNE